MLSEKKKDDLESEVRRSVYFNSEKGVPGADDDKAGGREWHTSYESGQSQRSRATPGMRCPFPPLCFLFLTNFIACKSTGRV
jgi:hypothetical protein